MKANHNRYGWIKEASTAVVNISKIQNESKSQPPHAVKTRHACCCQYFKDTK